MALYTSEPNEAELAAIGLTLEDVATSIEIWPENVRAFNVFQALGTQWRTGMSGPTGLDFMVAYRRMDRMGLSDDDYDQLDHDLQVMEGAALQVIHAER